MRKALTLGLGLLLAGAMSVAQTYPSSTPDQTQTQTSAQSTATSGGQMTVQGCLRGSDGNWTLTDQSGTTWKLMGSNDQRHVVKRKRQRHAGTRGESQPQHRPFIHRHGQQSADAERAERAAHFR